MFFSAAELPSFLRAVAFSHPTVTATAGTFDAIPPNVFATLFANKIVEENTYSCNPLKIISEIYQKQISDMRLRVLSVIFCSKNRQAPLSVNCEVESAGGGENALIKSRAK